LIGPELERRAHRFVGAIGFTARRNIEVLTEQNVTLAELDVVGVKFDETLKPDYVLVETSGGEKNFEDLLKLNSLSAFLPRCSVYYIGGNVSTDIVRFAERLRIRAMHTSRLDELETELGVQKNAYFGSFSDSFETLTEKYSAVLYEKKHGDLLRARSSLWLETDPFFRLKRSRSILRQMAAELDKSEDQSLSQALEFLSAEFVLLYVVGILEAAGELYALPDHQREVIFKERLIAGRISVREKEELMDRFYRFLVGYTRHLQRPMKIRRGDLKLTDPDETHLYDVISRSIRRAASSRVAPNILDILISSSFLEEHQKPLPRIGLPQESFDLEFVLKLIRDIVLPLFTTVQPKFVKQISSVQAKEFGSIPRNSVISEISG